MVLALGAPAAHGWGVAGHMVVTQVAYDRLSPGARAEVDRLIDLLADFEPKLDHAVTASVWMDEMRSAGWRSMDRWHYMGTLYNADGIQQLYNVHPDNAVEAIRQSVRTLENPQAPDLAKAIMLRVLLHVVGDLHQPLHAGSRVTLEHETGDRGGNDFLLPDTTGRPSNLHYLWDAGWGVLPRLEPNEEGMLTVAGLARELTRAVPESRVPEWREMNADTWARESFRLMTSVVYVGIEPGRPPSEVYQAKARLVTRRRLALAGYRLAALLERVHQKASAAKPIQ